MRARRVFRGKHTFSSTYGLLTKQVPLVSILALHGRQSQKEISREPEMGRNILNDTEIMDVHSI